MKLLSSVGNFFSLDIGSSGIRAVQLKRGGKNRQLVAYGAVDLPVFEPGRGSRDDILKSGINEIIKKSKINTQNVVLGCPSRHAFVTVVDFPKLKGSELAKAISLQADKIIPAAIDTVKMDWQEIGPSPVSPGHTEVIIATIDKEFAESRIDLAEEVGLSVVAIEPDSLATSRSLISLNQDNSSAQLIIDLSKSYTDITSTINGIPRIVRSIAVGEDNLIKVISQNLRVDNQQSSQLLSKFGLDRSKLDGQVYLALQSTIASLAQDIEKTLQFHDNRYQSTKVDKIIITGSLPNIPGVAQFLADTFKTQVAIGNAWLNIGYPESLYNQLSVRSNKFAVSCGLALREE